MRKEVDSKRIVLKRVIFIAVVALILFFCISPKSKADFSENNEEIPEKKTITILYEGWTTTFDVIINTIEVKINEKLHTIQDIVEINSMKYLIVEPKTMAENLLKDLKTNSTDYNLSIEDNESKILSNEDIVKTNEKIVLEGFDRDTKMRIVVKGDVNSDGEVGFEDIVKLNNYRLNKYNNEKNWNNTEKIALKTLIEPNITDEDINEINFFDIVALNNYRLRK